MNLIPRNDRIVVRRHPPKQQKGSIIIPDAASEKSQRGTILAVGPGKWHEGEWCWVEFEPLEGIIPEGGEWVWEAGWREPMTVKPGMEVYFSSRWNDLARDRFDDLPIGTDPMIHLLQDADILAIIG